MEEFQHTQHDSPVYDKCVESTIRTRDAVPQAEVCMCVHVCERALKLTGKLHFELRARPNDQIHTKYVKTAGLESYSLKHSLCLKVNENSWEKIECQHFVLVTDWCFINVNQRTKYKEKISHSS